MKTKWMILLGVNLANSFYMAFVLIFMGIQKNHAITLAEPNSFIITSEAFFAMCIVTLTIVAMAWNFLNE